MTSSATARTTHRPWPGRSGQGPAPSPASLTWHRKAPAATEAALSRLDEQSLLNPLAERVKNVLQAATAAVLVLDRAAGQLVATAASGIEEEARQSVRIPLGAGFAGRVAESREPVILTTVDHTTVRNPLLVDRGIKSLLGVPLLVGGNVIGVLGDVAGSGLEAAVIMGRMRSALRAYALESADPATALRLLDRKIQYFEPDAMATVLYGIYTPRTGEFTVSSAGHLPPVLAAPGAPAGLLPLRSDPPIGTADDPPDGAEATALRR